MSDFAKELGFFTISIFLVGIPFLTGLRLGMVGEADFLVLCGIILTLIGVAILMVLFTSLETKS